MMFEPYSMYQQYYIGTEKRQAKSCDPKTELAVLNTILYTYYKCKLYLLYCTCFEKSMIKYNMYYRSDMG